MNSNINYTEHWDNVYQTKEDEQLGWFAPPVVELPKEVPPESPDPRRNHRSKVVKGLPKEAPEDELEAERRRLRENYMVRRAQDYLSEKKYGS